MIIKNRIKVLFSRFQKFSGLGNSFTLKGDVFETFLRCTAKTIIYRRFTKVTLPRNLWSLCKIPESDKNFSSFNFSLYYTF